MQLSPRKCPHCRVTIPADRGFIFDTDLNMLCGACGKIIYPVNADSEALIPKKAGFVPPDILGPYWEEDMEGD